jgi:hypothetical protein
MKKDVELKTFPESYPKIEEIKEYENKDFGVGALGFLKHFYVKVWGSYVDYVENDLVLYEIFKKGNDEKDFIIEARIAVLDKMYGTRIKAFRKITEIFKENIKNDKNKFDSIIESLVNQKIDNGNTERQFYVQAETSFVSKYFHWYNEVNNSEVSPIYDGNVKNGLKKYVFGENIKDMGTLKESIDKFIGNLELKDDKINSESLVGTNRIIDWGNFSRIENYESKENNCLYNNVSIYRLIDKFLWLTYKIAEAKSEKNESVNQDAGGKKNKPQIPEKVINEFDELMKPKRHS